MTAQSLFGMAGSPHLEFYEQVRLLQEKYFETPSRSISNNLMTNGVNLDSSWLEFVTQYSWEVGVSIDGPELLHDTFRRFPSGKGSFKTTFANVRRFLKVGRRVGVNVVINRANVEYPEELFNFFTTNFKAFTISPCLPPRDGESCDTFSIQPQQYADFFIKMFDIWWKKDNPRLRVSVFSEYIQAVLGRKPKLCSMSNGCDRFLGIESDGAVYPCGRTCGYVDLCIGNIHETGLREVLNSRVRVNVLKKMLKQPEECVKCAIQFACFNGCPFHRYLGHGEFDEKSPMCSANKLIFEHVEARVRETLQSKETSDNG